ncbi:unnamed protein product, partial [Adineta ricciae]
MFVIKPPAYLNDNVNYHRKKKFFKRFDKRVNNNQTYDLRLIILRHAERVDLVLGESWYDHVFGGVPSAPPQSYQHALLPQALPHRINTLLYVFDPPITRSGEQKSYAKGQELGRYGINVDHCYSSPACRSVLTASAVLEGMNRPSVPIRLEPYLFEPMAWNQPLQMLDTISPFMSTRDWLQAGYNIDRHYQRLNDYLNPTENEYDFYNRSQYFFQSIERRHGGAAAGAGRGFGRSRRSNVLIVGHAATPLVFQHMAFRQPFNAEAFGQQCGNIGFLHTLVLERNAANRTCNKRTGEEQEQSRRKALYKYLICSKKKTKVIMTKTSDDTDSLHIEEDLDTAFGTIRRPPTCMKSPSATIRIPVRSNECLNCTVRSKHKSKTLSRKKPLTRYIYPRIPSRSESLIQQPADYYERDSYHHHYRHHHHHHHYSH